MWEVTTLHSETVFNAWLAVRAAPALSGLVIAPPNNSLNHNIPNHATDHHHSHLDDSTTFVTTTNSTTFLTTRFVER